MTSDRYFSITENGRIASLKSKGDSASYLAMKLDVWLRQTNTARSAFARQVGLSPASVTALCNDPTAWISRESAERIAAATGGAVTPNDFLEIGRASWRERV